MKNVAKSQQLNSALLTNTIQFLRLESTATQKGHSVKKHSRHPCSKYQNQSIYLESEHSRRYDIQPISLASKIKL